MAPNANANYYSRILYYIFNQQFKTMSRRSKNILDLTDKVDKKVRVTFQGGREVVGVLKGYDEMVNLVLEESVEFLKDGSKARNLGRVVCRGPQVTLVSPEEGFEQIENPFEVAEEDEGGQE